MFRSWASFPSCSCPKGEASIFRTWSQSRATKGASKSESALLRFDREPGPSEMKSRVPSITWATISRAAPSWLDGKTLTL